jgi:hypothetical protein
MVVNQDHYVQFVAYDTKPYTLTEKAIGTRYAFAAIRTLIDPNDPKDLDAVHKLQDDMKRLPASGSVMVTGPAARSRTANEYSVSRFNRMIVWLSIDAGSRA